MTTKNIIITWTFAIVFARSAVWLHVYTQSESLDMYMNYCYQKSDEMKLLLLNNKSQEFHKVIQQI